MRANGKTRHRQKSRSQIYLNNDLDPQAYHQQKSKDIPVTNRDCNLKSDLIF